MRPGLGRKICRCVAKMVPRKACVWKGQRPCASSDAWFHGWTHVSLPCADAVKKSVADKLRVDVSDVRIFAGSMELAGVLPRTGADLTFGLRLRGGMMIKVGQGRANHVRDLLGAVPLGKGVAACASRCLAQASLRAVAWQVKTLTGKEIEIDIEPNDTIARIKERVEEREGIPPVQQRCAGVWKRGGRMWLIVMKKSLAFTAHTVFPLLLVHTGLFLRASR